MNYVRNGWSLPNSGQLEIVTEPQQRAVSLEPGQVERAYFSVHVARIVLAERDHGSRLRCIVTGRCEASPGRTLHRADLDAHAKRNQTGVATRHGRADNRRSGIT